MNDLKKWYSNQPISSQLLLGLMTLLVLVLLVFELLIDPWQQKLYLSRSQVEDKVETVKWMQNQARTNRSLIRSGLSPKKTQLNNNQSGRGSLITRIEQTAKRIKIYSSIERISPDKVGRVKVWINNGDFNLWLKWVETIKKQGIDIVDARVSQLEGNDAVSITASFQSAK